ncbi:uncharacterized protein PRCAT00004013001 [Priceomyces carsonii]|uniref:uncharacterized protein n=1 Tax=Priceomyces carsonii TaxID=28549 RepID=UPI002ED8B81A|nr:unnamed protein product [Priceomyces carsonii]
MQYVGKVGDYVYNQWNSLNPATLSGAIDVIVVEQPDGSLHCSPWHVRFGKFQIIKPSQKKVDLYVNGIKTDLPMKLGDGGEAFFVFETDGENKLLSKSLLTSPVISATSSPGSSLPGSPRESRSSSPAHTPTQNPLSINKSEPDTLDLNRSDISSLADEVDQKIKLQDLSPSRSSPRSMESNTTIQSNLAFERAKKITQKLNIPSKIDINGDMVLDMDGYKPNAQKNIENSDELFKRIFFKEINDLNDNKEHELAGWDQIISKDENGNIRISNKSNTPELDVEDDLENLDSSPTATEYSDNESEVTKLGASATDKTYFKTLRLTSEQLQKMNLNYGENKLTFKLNQGTAQIDSYLYVWKSSTPLVISDIDGTITKSDALGHVLNLFGKDWTHLGVANLFQDIKANGYNIVYLTARSVGQADTTRQYLRGIIQDGGIKLPKGPVILSPDRTIAALKREVILKKPEVFKMSCLNDIRSLYFNDNDDDRTPFYAGFGNKITDAISYRSVKIPSHRIFTINPNGEVHMELLELAGYKSSYLHIGELVDHFFPPIREVSSLSSNWNDNQFNEYISHTQNNPPASPGSPRSIADDDSMPITTDEKFNDVNYWREPLNLSDLSDNEEDVTEPEEPKSPRLLKIRSQGSSDFGDPSSRRSRSLSLLTDRPNSVASFASPLKNFMMFGSNSTSSKNQGDQGETPDVSFNANESDYTDDGDYTDDDDYEDDNEEYEDDEDDDDEEDDEEDDDYVDEEDEIDDDPDYDNDEDVDFDDGLPSTEGLESVKPATSLSSETTPSFIKSSELAKKST